MAVVGTDKYGSGVYGEVVPEVYGVAGKVAWLVQVDWDNDGVWGDLIESQDIRSVHFKRGREGRMRGDGNGQNHPDGELFDIEIRDVDGKYDVFNADSEIYDRMGHPGLLIRILVVDTTSKAQAEPVFVGTLTGIDWDADKGWGHLSGSGLSRYLELGAASAVHSPNQSYTQPDSYFVEGSTIYPINYWNGRPEGLPLSECLGIVSELAQYPFGVTTSAIISQNEPEFLWIDGLTAWEHFIEIADGFAARLFFLRDGQMFGMDPADTSGLGVMTPPGSALRKTGLDRTKAFEGLFTKAKVDIHKFAAKFWGADLYGGYGATFQKCWENKGPIMVPANSVIYVEAEHDSGDQVPTLATHTFSEWSMEPNEVWTNADGTGTDLSLATGTGQGRVEAMTETIDGKTYMKGRRQKFTWLKFTNTSGSTAYFFNISLWGFGLWETGAKLSYEIEDTEMSAINGLRQLEIKNRVIQSETMAENIADLYLSACSTRDRASVSWLGYHANGNGIVDLLTGYDVGTVVDFGVQGGATALANYGVHGERLIVGQEVEWMDVTGQNIEARLCFERLPIIPVEINGDVSTGYTAGGSNITFSHTVEPGDDRLLVLFVTRRQQDIVYWSSLTYGGTVFDSRVSSGNSNDKPVVDFHYWKNPPVGTANIVIPLSANSYVEAAAMTLYNVDLEEVYSQDLIRDYYSTPVPGGSGTEISTTIESQRQDIVLDAVGAYFSSDPTIGDGQTQLWNVTSNGLWRGFGSWKQGSTSGNSTMSWTVPLDVTHGWGTVVVSIKGKYGA